MKIKYKVFIPGLFVLGLIILLLQPNPYFRRAIFYNLANIDDYKYFENREVKASEPREWNFANSYNSYILNTDELNFLDEYQTVSFLVIKDTSIIFESYWDEYSEKSISNSFSMAKSIVSLLIGIAIDEGKISSVNDPVAKYLPEFSTESKKHITIRDLLTMSSGLQWNESYFNPFSVTTKAYYGNNLYKLALKAKPKNNAGEKFDYITANTQLLSIIIKNVSNTTLSEYASEKLWNPLGAEFDASWSLDKKEGNEKAFCCFNSNARDFARIGQLIINKGSFNEKQIVSESYIKDMLVPAYYLIDENNKPVDFYGYQWWICNYKNTMIYYARGILGQYIICIPDKNLVIVRLGHKRSKKRINHHPEDLFGYIDLGLKIAE